MQNETKACQNCKKDFTIEPEDFKFYEKMKVPAPTWCPECRLIRRFSFMNMRTLYKRSCDLCGKNMISMFHENKSTKVYCMPCWWGDSWDGTEYAQNYDPSKNFFEQMKELRDKTPFMTLESLYTSHVNTPYTNYSSYQKNCYLTYFSDYVENTFYSAFLAHVRDCVDCYYIGESELCYENINGYKLYNCYFNIDCGDSHDVHFSRNCYDCSNCFGCVNLRKKNYCIWNKQYSREDYKNEIAKIDMSSWKTVLLMLKKLKDFSLDFPRRCYVGDSRNKNVSGEYVFESRNSHDLYMSKAVEDSAFTQFITLPKTKDAYDYTGWGSGAEKVYECAIVGEGTSNVKFSDECWINAMNIEYSMYAIGGCKDCFGCVNLKKKQYCILNKQYSKEEYEKLKIQIIEDMDKNPYVDEKGRVYKYGEFLPLMLSPFSYNETLAQEYFPLSKEEIEEKGFSYFEIEKPIYKITKKAKELTDSILDVVDDILNDVIECLTCKRGFKIIENELIFLRRFGLPLPRSCPECRHKARFMQINLPKLYDRKCAKCESEIKTSYSPDRLEIVYCEKCYQQEVY